MRNDELAMIRQRLRDVKDLPNQVNKLVFMDWTVGTIETLLSEIGNLHRIIRSEQTKPPFDVADDQTTELAVELAAVKKECDDLKEHVQATEEVLSDARKHLEESGKNIAEVKKEMAIYDKSQNETIKFLKEASGKLEATEKKRMRLWKKRMRR